MTRLEHLLTIAMEECAELSIRLSKAKRFGLHEVQPGQTLTNIERCRYEYSDLVATLEMIAPPTAAGGTIHPPSGRMMDEKREKIEHFLSYSAECGTLSNGVSTRPAAEAPQEPPGVSALDRLRERVKAWRERASQPYGDTQGWAACANELESDIGALTGQPIEMRNLARLYERLLQMADEQNTRQQAVYGVADIRDAVEREDVLRSAAAGIQALAVVRAPQPEPEEEDLHLERHGTEVQWAASFGAGSLNLSTEADADKVVWLLRQLARVREAWQPIATAPKDRVYIGGFIDDHGELRDVRICSGDWSKILTHWLDAPVPMGNRFAQTLPSAPRVSEGEGVRP